MDASPDQPRGTHTVRPGDSIESIGAPERAGGLPSWADDGRGARVSGGGTPAALGLVLALLAGAGIWVGLVVHGGDRRYLAVAALLGLVSVGASLVGWRAAWASGASGRGPLACALLGAVALVGAVVLLAAG